MLRFPNPSATPYIIPVEDSQTPGRRKLYPSRSNDDEDEEGGSSDGTEEISSSSDDDTEEEEKEKEKKKKKADLSEKRRRGKVKRRNGNMLHPISKRKSLLLSLNYLLAVCVMYRFLKTHKSRNILFFIFFTMYNTTVKW